MKEKKDTFRANIPEIERIIGYTFTDKSLLTQAFTRTSYCNEQKQRGNSIQSNEVLEFVGDSVLSLSIITFLMRENAERYEYGIHTKLDEGDFSNVKSKLSDKTNLSRCITALGLEKYLRLGEGDKKLGIENEPSVMEDLFESIVGAVYFDCDMSVGVVMGVVSRMLDLSAYTVKTPPIQSSKNALQEFCADKKRRLPPPVYKTLGEEGPDHKKVYERGVYIGERLVARAKGKNRKLADAAAAEAALAVLEDEKKEKAAPTEEKPEAKPKDSKTEAKTKDSKTEAKTKDSKTEAKKPNSGKKPPEKATEKKPEKAPEKKPEKKAEKPTAPTKKAEEKKPPKEEKPTAKAKTAAPKAENSTPKTEKSTKKAEKTTDKKPEKNGKPKKEAATPTPEAKPSKKQTKVDKKDAKKTATAEPKATVKKPLNLTRPTTNAKKPNVYEASASAKLKTHAMRSGVATPSFKDLGEVRDGSRVSCRVECIFMGKRAVGTGATRPEAKENAASKLLASLSPTKEDKKPTAKKSKKK